MNRFFGAVVMASLGLFVGLPQGLAGAGSTGGAVGFKCKGKVYLADSYSLKSLPVYKHLKRLNLKNGDQATADMVNAIAINELQLAALLQQSLNEITTETPRPHLDLLGNDGLDFKDVPPNCSKVQIAIQHFENGELEYDVRLRKKLSPLDKVLFKIHEGFLRVLWKAKNDPNVMLVRDQVFKWAKDPSFTEFLGNIEYQRIEEQGGPIGACLMSNPVNTGSQFCARVRRRDCQERNERYGAGSGIFLGGPCGPLN